MSKGRMETWGTVWAKECAKPVWIPQGRARGVKRMGVRYEQAFMDALGPNAVHGQWFEVEDAQGRFWCQVDGLMRGADGALIVMECKNTWVAEGIVKLARVYVPVVRAALGRPGLAVLPVLVCKNLTPEARNVHQDLREAVSAARPEIPAVLHWSGMGEIQGLRAMRRQGALVAA